MYIYRERKIYIYIYIYVRYKYKLYVYIHIDTYLYIRACVCLLVCRGVCVCGGGVCVYRLIDKIIHISLPIAFGVSLLHSQISNETKEIELGD